MSTNKQALRKLAKVLSGKAWVAFTHKASKTFAVGTLGHKRGEDVVKWTGFDGQANAEAKAKFIAAASPATVIALLDELEAAERRNADLEELLEAEVRLWTQRYDCANSRREAAEKRIATLGGIILSSRNFINDLDLNGDAGAAEFIAIIDRAAGITVKGE